jgi:hypothetical protein
MGVVKGWKTHLRQVRGDLDGAVGDWQLVKLLLRDGDFEGATKRLEGGALCSQTLEGDLAALFADFDGLHPGIVVLHVQPDSGHASREAPFTALTPEMRGRVKRHSLCATGYNL